MRIIEVAQGTLEWLSLRKKYHTASESPVLMGCSKYKSRGQLLLEKKGLVKDEPVDDFKKNLFQKGHAAESAGRKIAEERFEQEFYPVVGICDQGRFLASFDGINILGDLLLECKLNNKELTKQIESGELEPFYYWQLEHQLLVSRAEKVLFVACDADGSDFKYLFYASDPKKREKLLAHWDLFEGEIAAENISIDSPAKKNKGLEVRNFEVQMALVGDAVATSNLAHVSSELSNFVKDLDSCVGSDDFFAIAENATKTFTSLEKKLQALKTSTIAGLASANQMFLAADSIIAESRNARLRFEKIVAEAKYEAKVKIFTTALEKYNIAASKANETLGFLLFKTEMVENATSFFSDCAKNLKTTNTLQAAVDCFLANKLVELDGSLKKCLAKKEKILTIPEKYSLLFDSPEKLFSLDIAEIDSYISKKIKGFESAFLAPAPEPVPANDFAEIDWAAAGGLHAWIPAYVLQAALCDKKNTVLDFVLSLLKKQQ